MKRIVLFLSLLLPVLGYAQNYNPLQFGPKTYFTNSNGYLRGMRIDSVGAVGADSVYYPYRSARVVGYNYDYSVFPLTTDFDGGSWLGKRVIKQNNGTWLFDNIWNDTVVIKSQAAVGDAWPFFNDVTNISYIATVTSIDTMTVLGSVDSVKTIQITADTAGIPRTWDPVNNFQIKLSKDHGFVQAIDLYTFPYHMPDSSSDILFLDFYLDFVIGRNIGLGELHPMPYRGGIPDTLSSVFKYVELTNPRKKDVYDFNDGDVYESERQYHNISTSIYQYYYYNDTVYGTVSTPYNKSFSTFSHYTQIVYDMSPTPYVYHYDGTSGGSFDTTGLLDLDKMPEEVGCQYVFYYFPGDTVVGANCTIKDKYRVENNHVMYGDTIQPVSYTHGPDFGVEQLAINATTYYPYYGQWIVDYNDANVTDHRECTYMYKNGGICFGVFRSLYEGVSDINNSIGKVTLSPNPADNELTIEVDKPGKHVMHFMNMLGQIIVTSTSNNVKETIDTRNIPDGIYNVVISDQGGGRIAKKLVVSH
jgi:hypothetical protein